MLWSNHKSSPTVNSFFSIFGGVMSYVVGAEGGQNIQKIVIGRELLGKEYVPYK